MRSQSLEQFLIWPSIPISTRRGREVGGGGRGGGDESRNKVRNVRQTSPQSARTKNFAVNIVKS